MVDKDAVWLRQALTEESQWRTSGFWSKAIPLTASHLKNSSWHATKSLAMQLKYYATTPAHHELDIADLLNHSWVETEASYQTDKEKRGIRD